MRTDNWWATHRKCADGGTCHHACVEACWRSTATGPLSGVFVGDEWPIYPAVGGVLCGERGEPDEWPCPRPVWRTYGPAGSLWCEVHGHLMDVLARRPLTGTAIVCPR